MSQLLTNLSLKGLQTFDLFCKHIEKLGSPHQTFRTIHVGGTNGKGSVATKIAAALQAQGYKVGLYTSPHIRTFRERIQINGIMIPESTAETLLTTVYDPHLAYFDVLTALAFVYFAQQKVDFAVIEVGMGGRLDATNVITPLLSIITSIGYDHTQYLGPTLEAIAREKGGIVKPNVPLIVGKTAAPFFPNAIHAESAPFYDLENRLIAKRALALLGIDSEEGLDQRPPCRFQRIGDLILDVAHNPPAFERLKEALLYHFPNNRFPFYLGFSKDKDWRTCIKIIDPIASEITFLHTDNPRLISFPNAKRIRPTSGVVAGSFYIMECLR